MGERRPFEPLNSGTFLLNRLKEVPDSLQPFLFFAIITCFGPICSIFKFWNLVSGYRTYSGVGPIVDSSLVCRF